MKKIVTALFCIMLPAWTVPCLSAEVNGPKIFWMNHYNFLTWGGATTSTDNLGLNISSAIKEVGVYTAVRAPEGATITGIRICYAIHNTNSSNVRSFINKIRLSQVEDPPVTASIRLDDETDLKGPGSICVNSGSTSIDSSAGPVRLDLFLNFGSNDGSADTISIRGVGVLFEATE